MQRLPELFGCSVAPPSTTAKGQGQASVVAIATVAQLQRAVACACVVAGASGKHTCSSEGQDRQQGSGPTMKANENCKESVVVVLAIGIQWQKLLGWSTEQVTGNHDYSHCIAWLLLVAPAFFPCF